MATIRIVCIEDEPDMIALLHQLLIRYGFEMMGAKTGKEGVALVQELQPDLVLLDIMMPDMNGWSVYEQLKNDTATATIPVIVVTARATPSEKLMALRQAKVDDYIIKPFAPSQLKDSIDRVLALKASENDTP
jgi:two-component system, OmpR family, response regulator VicR